MSYGFTDVDYADGSRVEIADAHNTVHVAYNGPLFVRGDLNIADAPENAPGLNFRAPCVDAANHATSLIAIIHMRRKSFATMVLLVKRAMQTLPAAAL